MKGKGSGWKSGLDNGGGVARYKAEEGEDKIEVR